MTVTTRIRTVRWRYRAAAAVTVAGLALAGCTSAGPETPSSDTSAVTEESAQAAQAVAEAAQKTTAAGSARIKGTIVSNDLNQGGGQIKMTGVYDFENSAFQADVDAGLGGKNNTISMILVNQDAYIKMAFLGPKWVKAPLNELGLDQSVTPEDTLAALTDISGLQEAGSDTIDGQPTTKYTGTIEVEDLVPPALDETADPSDPSPPPSPTASLKGTASVTVWVDQKGRVVKVQTETDAAVAGESGATDITMRFYDFGVKADIKAPPKDQVGELGELQGLGQQFG